MAKTDLKVAVIAKLDVDQKTAETCLRLVEAYINAHHVQLVCNKKPDGEMELCYEPAG